MSGTNGWEQWGKHVLTELKSLRGEVKCLDTKMDKLTISVVILKVKAGMWGMLGGAVVAGAIGMFFKAMCK